MGLSSSQARLLNLTSRMHDIEYKAQNLEAQKLQMANESTAVYKEYEDALNKQKVQLKSVGSDGSSEYKDASFSSVISAGYRINLCMPRDTTSPIFKTGEWVQINDVSDVNDVISSALGLNPSDTKLFSNMVEAGLITFSKKDANNNITETNVATDTGFQEISDESDVKKAEAKYESSMAKIDAKDKKFDTDIASLDNERTAIKTEIDTLKTVAKDNVDRTFKLFSQRGKIIQFKSKAWFI